MSERKVMVPRQDTQRVIAKGQAWAPHQDLYHWVLRRSWFAFFFLVSGIFLILNTLFALAYRLQSHSISGSNGTISDDFFFSVHTMCTIGYGTMAPATHYSNVLVVVEALVGILFTALITGLTFARFSRPTARVLFADKAVVMSRNGVPHLMMRMANWRHNLVSDAQLRVFLLVAEETREGEHFRRVVDIPLLRERTPAFILSWTAMHVIDESSPFYGPDAIEKLRTLRAEMFLTLVGMDETIGQNIHARKNYSLDDIVWNARFADVLEVLPDGTRVLDYRRFHDIVRVESA
jgi:inward rectifier potassium channel